MTPMADSAERLVTQDRRSLSLLIGLITILFSDVIFFGHGFYRADLTAYDYPLKRTLHLIVARGFFPWWNPFYSGGQPLAANPAYELFYPPQWLIFLPDFNLGFRLQIVAHIFLAAIGMYCLLRSLELRPLSSTVGALSFSIGGGFLSETMRLPLMFSMAWIPVILLFGRRFFLRPNRRDFAITALLCGAQVLIGEPTTVAQTWLLLGAYGLYRAADAEARWKMSVRNSAFTALLALSALAVGAVQIIPGLDFARDTVRRDGFSLQTVSTWSMPWYRPMEMIYPALFRYIGAGDDEQITRLYEDREEPFLSDLYGGWIFGVLLLLTPFVPRKGRGFVLLLLGGSLLLALGSHTPLLHLLYTTGLFRSIRYPEKFTLIAIVTSVVWGSVLLDAILGGDRKLRINAVRVCVGLIIVAAVLAVTLPLPRAMAHDIRAPLQPSPFDLTQPRYYWPLNLARGAFFLLLFAGKRNRQTTGWSIALITFTTLDLLYLHPRLVPRMPASFFSEPAAVRPIATLARTQTFRVFHEADWDWIRRKPLAEKWFEDPHTYWWMFRNGAFPRNMAGWGIETVFDHDVDETALSSSAAFMRAAIRMQNRGSGSNWRDALFAISNIEYTTAFRPDPPRKPGKDPMALSPITFVRTGSYPRYYFADRLLSATTEDELVAGVTDSWKPGSAFTSSPP
ncbi:MAG TPA: hypothetical protein VHL58_12375, partial [Thermoanaerobaculia bacterium]|nr:hypothetical protein [Thermoanaerobaculia bacterium]